MPQASYHFYGLSFFLNCKLYIWEGYIVMDITVFDVSGDLGFLTHYKLNMPFFAGKKQLFGIVFKGHTLIFGFSHFIREYPFHE